LDGAKGFKVFHVPDQEPDRGDEGAQTSAAWCLSAVLLFMSMVLLRQAFEPPLGSRENAPGPSTGGPGSGSSMQQYSLGSSLVFSTLPAEAMTTADVPALHENAASQVRVFATRAH
jgi:hypothetical protein